MDDATPQFLSPDTLPEPPGFSHVVTARPGRVVWTSGQVAMNADGTAAPPGDWEAQTRLCFENVGRALAAAGASWPDVVKLTFFVVDVTALPTIRAVRDEFVATDNPPASSLVQVAGLFRPDLLIEVEAVACPAD
jgi:enamine deaminase RidA (YjgF/YER057c/UK114 family)